MVNLDNRKQGGIGYILDLASSYCKSKVLFVAAELDIFSVMSRTKKNAQEIAQRLGLEKRPAEMLLNACVALGLLEKKDDLFFNSSTAEMFLIKNKPLFIGKTFNVFDKRWYKLWDRLKEAVETNKPQAYKEGEGDLFEEVVKNKKEMHNYFEGLHALAYWPASSLAQIFDFTPYNHLLDVGGGSGAYSIAAVKRHQHLRATILDLPPVCKISEDFITKEKLSDRIKTFPGNFFEDSFPKGIDLVLLSNILHGWNEDNVERLLKKTFKSLPSKGSVIIRDMVLSNDGTEPLHAALMSLTLLLEYREGSNYTGEQYSSWLDRAGFKNIAIKPLVEPNKIVTAVKP